MTAALIGALIVAVLAAIAWRARAPKNWAAQRSAANQRWSEMLQPCVEALEARRENNRVEPEKGFEAQ